MDRFANYTFDYEPAHVHVTGARQAKINLLGPDGVPSIVFSIGIKRSDMRRLFSEAVTHRDFFLQEWDRIHGQNNQRITEGG
jgi:hypothetical protein